MLANLPQFDDSINDDEVDRLGKNLIIALLAAVARPGATLLINTLIKQICVRKQLERPKVQS